MKLSHILIALTCCVYSTFTASSFIEEGKRAELFEITDNEVPVIKITIPEEDYELMRTKASIGAYVQSFSYYFKDILTEAYYLFKLGIEPLQIMNFKVLFPDENLSETFPELNINDLGYPEINVEEIMNGFDWDPTHYIDNDFGVGSYYLDIARTNSNFDFEKIIYKVISVKNEIVEELDPEVQNVIVNYKQMFGGLTINDFKTKNATMSVDINGEHKQFDKVTLSLGGVSTRYFQKPGFNIKIRGGDDLYGRTQLKLRSENSDPTVLRTKLVTDIRNNLGLSTISANYATVYVNNDFLGFFVLRDAFKPSWIESEFGEKDTKSLYKCEGGSYLTKDYSSVTCKNEDETIEDKTELIEFLTALDKAQSASDIEDIFEVDQFLTDMALEYLFGAWDHILYTGQNYYIYKQSNGKWKYLPYDHDYDFGMHMDRVGFAVIFADMPERTERVLNKDYPNLPYSDWIIHHHLTDILIYKDPSRFEKILKDIVVKVFNPDTLYPHIDELKEFIKPYIEKELLEDNEIIIYNPNGLRTFTYEEWDANSEYTSVRTQTYYAYGLKYWILGKYRYMCKTYQDIKCNSIYLDENYEYPINKNVEFTGYTESDLTPLDFFNIEETTTSIDVDEPTLGIDIDEPTSDIIEEVTTDVNDLLEGNDNEDPEEITDPIDEMDVIDSESDSDSDDDDDDNVQNLKTKRYIKNKY